MTERPRLHTGEPYDFDEAKVNSGGLPKHGTLEFDYVSTDARFRQADNCPVMPDCTFKLFLLHMQRIRGKGLTMQRDVDRLKREEAEAMGVFEGTRSPGRVCH